MNNKTKLLLIGVIITAIIVACLAILIPTEIIQYNLGYDNKYIQDGINCFANGVLCKNISCDMPGGCYAKDCIGGVEYSGAIKIKCINISRSK